MTLQAELERNKNRQFAFHYISIINQLVLQCKVSIQSKRVTYTSS